MSWLIAGYIITALWSFIGLMNMPTNADSPIELFIEIFVSAIMAITWPCTIMACLLVKLY